MKLNCKFNILDELFEIRGGDLIRNYIDENGQPNLSKEANEAENELVEFMKKFMKNEKDKKELFDKINNFESKAISEMCFWHKPYYKWGFIDGMLLKKQINEEKIKSDTNIYDFVGEIWDYIDREKYSNLKKNDEYTKTNRRIAEIKDEYPNVRNFYEDNKIVKFTEEEMQALVEVKELYDKINILESEEIFRIGLRQGKSL